MASSNLWVRDTPPRSRRRVLNAGSGPASRNSLHKAFVASDWDEVRLDLDPQTKPDILGTISDMRSSVKDATFDAIWCSHNIEHLYAHEVVPALIEFRRILKTDGFVFITCPDLGAVCRCVLEQGLDRTIYVSQAGPVTPLDMIYGHVRSVAGGNHFMSHHCGFTDVTLARVGFQAGYSEVRVAKGSGYDLWALMLMPGAKLLDIKRLLEGTSERFLVES